MPIPIYASMPSRLWACTLTLQVVFGLLCAPLQAQPPEPHHRHATLDARLGAGLIEGRTFDVIAMYLGVSTFYFGLGFYEESHARTQNDDMVLEGLTLTGRRSRRTLQMPFIFGSEVYRYPGRYVDIRVDGQFKGGLELEFNHLRTESGSKIPGSPDANYFLGGGIRAQIIHPVGQWFSDDFRLFHSWYVGISAETDVCFRQIGIESSPESVYTSLLTFVVLGSKKLAFL